MILCFVLAPLIYVTTINKWNWNNNRHKMWKTVRDLPRCSTQTKTMFKPNKSVCKNSFDSTAATCVPHVCLTIRCTSPNLCIRHQLDMKLLHIMFVVGQKCNKIRHWCWPLFRIGCMSDCRQWTSNMIHLPCSVAYKISRSQFTAYYNQNDVFVSEYILNGIVAIAIVVVVNVIELLNNGKFCENVWW